MGFGEKKPSNEKASKHPNFYSVCFFDCCFLQSLLLLKLKKDPNEKQESRRQSCFWSLYGGKINKLCSSKCRLDSYFQLCRINFNSCTVISSRFFVCRINFNSCTVISSPFFVCWKVVQLYNFSAHEKPTGNDCAGIKVNSAHEKPTENNCAGIKVNSAQLEITVQSAFGAVQFIDFTPRNRFWYDFFVTFLPSLRLGKTSLKQNFKLILA